MTDTKSETPRPKRPALLVVDDTVTNLDILVEALGQDYTVRVDTDGLAAIDSARDTLPDLILLDVMMPGIDGFEVCRRLKAEPATRDIPIIFLTAMNEDSDMAYGLHLGAGDYITKPFNPAIVKARVRNHLELKQHRDHLTALVAQKTGELAKAHERLLELGRLNDDFLGMISHEIRTPANGVLGIGGLIIDLCPPSEDSTRYSALFRSSGARLCQLMDDVTMIIDLKNRPEQKGGAIAFPVLLDQVRNALPDIHIATDMSTAPPAALDACRLKGDDALLKRSLAAMVQLAACFSLNKHRAQLTGVETAEFLQVRLAVDALPLAAAAAANFFEIDSCVRPSSAAEPLGLSPVVAHRIISSLGGTLRLIKGEGQTGCVEAHFIRHPS